MALALLACKGSDSGATAGVDDVRKACEIRKQWTQRSRQECTDCMSLSAAPACGCPKDKKEYSGRCSTPQAKRVAEKACYEPTVCANNCPRSDCECVERCYQASDQCRKLAAAVDGCVADVCDSFCR